MAPTLKVVCKSDAWTSSENPGEGPQAFNFTKLILQNNDGGFFYAKSNHRYKSNAEVDISQLDMHPILASHIHPLFPTTGLTQAPDPLPADSYIKRPSLLDYGDDSVSETEISDLVLHEAEICETLMRSPHPNIARYHGCVVENGRITGLCFVKYDTGLNSRLKDYSHSLTKYVEGIRNGIQYLHSLNLIHNDINPSNIMLNAKDDVPVIIDFDSCQAEGSKIMKGGTWGWSNESSISLKENDYHGLGKIVEAIEEHDRLVEAQCDKQESNIRESVPLGLA
ncbi:MAG: hypothetical protein M1812_004867 [Candelaria pacifica]|nr:MAG: hypothetical protein M1812_004867 [Candelaria pacifica]